MSTVCTDKGRGHSCCPPSRCDPRHWMRVPTRCCRVLRTSPDSLPPRCFWAFSVWVWPEWIQCLAAHTLHLQEERQSHVSNQVDSVQRINGYMWSGYKQFWQNIMVVFDLFLMSVPNCKKMWRLRFNFSMFHLYAKIQLHEERHVKHWVILSRSFEGSRYSGNTDKNWKNTTV